MIYGECFSALFCVNHRRCDKRLWGSRLHGILYRGIGMLNNKLKNMGKQLSTKLVTLRTGYNYKLSPKSLRNCLTSNSGQSPTAFKRPTKKRITAGSSTNTNPPIKARFLWSHAARSAVYLTCDKVNTRLGTASRTNSISARRSLPSALRCSLSVPRSMPLTPPAINSAAASAPNGYCVCGMCAQNCLASIWQPRPPGGVTTGTPFASISAHNASTKMGVWLITSMSSVSCKPTAIVACRLLDKNLTDNI